MPGCNYKRLQKACVNREINACRRQHVPSLCVGQEHAEIGVWQLPPGCTAPAVKATPIDCAKVVACARSSCYYRKVRRAYHTVSCANSGPCMQPPMTRSLKSALKEDFCRADRRSILRCYYKFQRNRDDGAQPGILINARFETNSTRYSYQPAIFRHSNYGE